MATFKVPVIEIEVFPHPNADRLEVAKAKSMDYNMVVPKGQYKTGDEVVYIPEQAIVPDNILIELGLDGKLAGKNKNRVKAMKLRGIISQGIVYPNIGDWDLGSDVAEALCIEKYEVPIPVGMKGEVCNLGIDKALKFDVDNIKNYPNVFTEQDLVEITEKVHGTFMIVCGFPENGYYHDEIMSNGKSFCSSKGLINKGLGFKDNEVNKDNVYIRTTKKFKLNEISVILANRFNTDVYLLGETFGKGIQDLGYDQKTNDVKFCLFDIATKENGYIKWMDRETVKSISEEFNIKMTTVLYTGKFNKEKVLELTDGKETISGNESHLREGVVIRDLDPNARDEEIGRKMLKSISFDYLNRKNATEYN